jgi:glycosyltransferase involved in cell wall biosynthesis
LDLLHISSGRLYGGIERMLVTMARAREAAPQLTHAYAVAAPGRLIEELRGAQADVELLGDVRLSRPPSVVAARRAFRTLLRERRPDAVICHAPWSYALFAGVSRAERIRTIWWQHDAVTGVPVVERWARTVRADLVISNSRWTARSAPLVQPRSRVEVVYCPVAPASAPPNARADLRGALGAAPGHVVLLAASRLDPMKGHPNLLRGLARLAGNPAWMLWIAGGVQRPSDARYLARLERLAGELGLASRVRFLGERRDVQSLMAAADVLVQANERPEAFGVVFAEAMLGGLPVITTDMGGAPEIVTDACGRLVTPKDEAGMAECLDELIGSPALRTRLAAAGRRHAAALCAPEVVLPRLHRVLAYQETTAAA